MSTRSLINGSSVESVGFCGQRSHKIGVI